MLRAKPVRYMLVGATGALLLSVFATAHSQVPSRTINVTPSDYDRYVASQAQNVSRHARPASTPAGQATGRSELSSNHGVADAAADPAAAAAAAAAAPAAAPDAGGIRYPGDLEYHGGPVVTAMRSHLIYVNLASSTTCSTAATCWGDPRAFLRDLGQSSMIHIVDQYTAVSANNRYTVSEQGINVNYPDPQDIKQPYTDNDMLAIVHAVVAANDDLRTGYGDEYHIFLVPGQDECFTATFTTCYSPDIPASFRFCAYHGSADFTDIGHVLYSVEPFQNVRGCHARPNGPQGPLADSTNNVLSHETFETITDPDGTAWWNSLDNGLRGQEIGDECSFVTRINNVGFFDPSDVTLNGTNYIIQPEYDNAQHGCTTTPP